jgi:CheY-like chemotaxis protein
MPKVDGLEVCRKPRQVPTTQPVYVILLTATPHNGDERAFRALCDLGARDQDSLLIFRRSRREIALGSGRRIHRLHVYPTGPERLMHGALAELASAVAAERSGTDRAEADRRLALSVFYKRALSSAYALEQSASRRVRSLTPDSAGASQQLALPLDDGTGDLDPADAAPTFGGPLAKLLSDEAAELRGLFAMRRGPCICRASGDFTFAFFEPAGGRLV